MCYFLTVNQCPDIPFIVESDPTISNDTSFTIDFQIEYFYTNLSMSNGTNPTLTTNSLSLSKLTTLAV